MSEVKEPRIREKVVDSNEPGTIREKLLELGWIQKRLHSGDYWFFTHDFKKVGVTRKEINDLLGSLSGTKVQDGKRIYNLPQQLEEMLDEFNYLIFLIEGSWRMVSPTQKILSPRGIEYYTWNMVWNFLRRWQDKGFTLELTVNEGHTIRRLNELYALYQKPYSASAKSNAYPDDRVLAFPSGCRGKTAMNCLNTFGTLLSVAQAPVSELTKIPDIGAKKAALIYNHFHTGEADESKIVSSGIHKERLPSKEEIQQGKINWGDG